MKRPRGLYHRKSGGFHAWVRVDGVLRQRKMGNTLVEADRAFKAARAAGGVPPSTTVAQASKLWLEQHVAIRRRGARDRAIVAGRTRDYLNVFLGFDRVANLRYARLAEYRLWLDGTGRAPQTISLLMSDVRSLCRWLVRTGRLDRSPFDTVLMPSVPETVQRAYDSDEVAKLEALPGELGFQLRLGIGTGLRFGDLCRLDRGQHFEGAALAIVAEKTGRVVRVPIGVDLAAEIARRVGRLFPRSSTSSGSFNRTVRERSGVLDFHAHGMRHTFAHRALAGGIGIMAIRDLLGHASVTTTERYLRKLVAPPAPVENVTARVTSIVPEDGAATG